jgi:hypothetical protein
MCCWCHTSGRHGSVTITTIIITIIIITTITITVTVIVIVTITITITITTTVTITVTDTVSSQGRFLPGRLPRHRPRTGPGTPVEHPCITLKSPL